MGEATISPYLNYRSINKVDIGIVSHNDNDHAGGVHYLLETGKVAKLIVSNLPEQYQF